MFGKDRHCDGGGIPVRVRIDGRTKPLKPRGELSTIAALRAAFGHQLGY
jgi:hypothetical protein